MWCKGIKSLSSDAMANDKMFTPKDCYFQYDQRFLFSR